MDFVSFYITTASYYNMQVYAYSESGILVQKMYIYNSTKNQYITLRSTLGMIHRLTFYGDLGFENYWTIDDLSYIVHVPGDNQLLTFDELAATTNVENLYDGVTFSPGYITWNSTGSSYYPPQTGPMVIYSNEIANNITFDIPKAYVSFYICTVGDYDLEVNAYNTEDDLIQTFYVEPDTINQFVELYSNGVFIHRISITGLVGFYSYWTIDSLYFEEYVETFEFLLDFEDYQSPLTNLYPHIIFSDGFISWESSTSPFYPPNSGQSVAYSHETSPNITFTIPIMYVSFYISGVGDYSLDVLAYSLDEKLIFKTSVEPDSLNKLIEIYSENSEINRITLNGTSGYQNLWTLDSLYYFADIYTYDLDGDGLSYYEEMIYGTDPLDWDSDNDGYSDGQEIAEGTDPNNPLDYPVVFSEFNYISLILFVPIFVVLGLFFRRRR
ncbi:MAG: thrombospondin type 3 repeat-containing protein [Candidatus Heimdallarchaeaceae archaeon]